MSNAPVKSGTIAHVGRTIGGLVMQLLGILGGLAARGYGFVEHWLLDSKEVRGSGLGER